MGLNSGGFDLICNPHNVTALSEAVSRELVTAAALDRALTNAFSVLFKVGMFAPLASSSVFQLGLEQLSDAKHGGVRAQHTRLGQM